MWLLALVFSVMFAILAASQRVEMTSALLAAILFALWAQILQQYVRDGALGKVLGDIAIRIERLREEMRK